MKLEGNGADTQRGPDLEPGSVVADRFEIERLAGSGGMGTVYRALDKQRGAAVALKVLWSPVADVPTWIEREARILASIKHPAVAAYVAHGAGPEGLRYLAMEWHDGEILDARIRRGPMRIEEALLIANRVAEALISLHNRGIVHRDLKPPNLVLAAGDPGQIKILDFGIASFAEVNDPLHDGPIGTPFYMAPEQARGDSDVDARADLYALGCILFECLTGRTPFVAASPLAVLAKTLFEEPIAPSEIRPGMPAGIDALVDRLLKKDRAARPSDALSVAEEIQALRAIGGASPPTTAPAAPALTRSERRLVSVVLASEALKLEAFPGAPGSYALGTADTGDPESTIPILPSIEQPLKRLREVGRQHGAQLELLRDGSIAAVLAGTGSPMDLASDAARCALALRALLPEARFSLVTGWEVFTGMQPVGQVIDRAAALLDAFPTGAANVVLLDPMTAALLGPRFLTAGAREALSLEGEREALEEEARRLLGRPTTCVGRADELHRLEELLETSVRTPAARAVVVTAGPGMGKSRLRDELVAKLRAGPARDGVEVWSARGDSMRRKASFGLLGQLVQRAAGLHEDEPLELRRQKLAARVARFVADPLQRRVSEFLGELVGTPFPAEESVQLRTARHEPMLMGDQMRRAWIDFLEAECRAHPVVVVLDDLQWGDAPTVDFLDTALRLLADRPLFVLALARPEVSEAFPELWRERGAAILELGPLSAEACLDLATQVLGPGAIDVIVRIFERSAGNAFFLEELVRAEAEGRGGELPDTVLAVMQSRLATLDPEARRVLRAGSLFGEVFWRGAVAPLLGLSPRAPPLLERLAELEQLEWISRNPDPKYGGEDECVFRNALVREAAYEMLTEEDRALGHRLAGGWLEGAGERDAMTLARHFDQGGDLERAAGWYRTAALQALEGNDLAGAAARVDRAIACGASGALLGELCLIRAEAHRWQASFAEGVSWAARAQGELPKGSAGWFAALREALASMVDPNDRDRVLAAADVLIELWSGSAEVIEAQVGAMVWAAIRLLVMGEKERARTIYDKLLEVEGRFGDEPELRGSIGTAHAFWQAFAEGDMSAAGERFQAASESFLEAGDLRSVCHMRANLAHVYNELGAHRENVELLRAIVADSRRLGLANFEAAAQSFLGKVLLMLARYDAAIEAETEAIAAFVKQGDRRLEGVAHAYLGLILRRTGELSRAEVEARKAMELLSPLPTLAPLSLAVLSSVLLAQGHVAEALVEARSANAAAEQAEEGEALIRLVLVEALLAGGELEAAREAVERAGARLLERSEHIKNPAWRRAFLEDVEENARTLSLLRAWSPEEKA